MVFTTTLFGGHYDGDVTAKKRQSDMPLAHSWGVAVSRFKPNPTADPMLLSAS